VVSSRNSIKATRVRLPTGIKQRKKTRKNDKTKRCACNELETRKAYSNNYKKIGGTSGSLHSYNIKVKGLLYQKVTYDMTECICKRGILNLRFLRHFSDFGIKKDRSSKYLDLILLA